MSSGYIIFTLESTLYELGITRNRLAVEAKVRPATILDWASGDVKAVQLDTLISVLDALNRIAQEKGITKRYNIEDVLMYTPF